MKQCFAIIIFFIVTVVSAQPASQTENLNALNKNIESIQTDLQQSSVKKSRLQTLLKKTETSEKKIKNQVKKTQNKVWQRYLDLKKLKRDSAVLSQEKNDHLSALKEQIRAAYLYSQQSYLKLLLAPDDVDQTQRILMYFHFVTNAQLQLMKKLEGSVANSEKNQAAIQQQYNTLLALRKAKLKSQQSLEGVQDHRRLLLQKISHDIQTKHQKLTQLLQDKKRLQKTLKTLSLAIPYGNSLFSKLQGKLLWPVSGSLRHRFGTQVERSELKWDGDVINAPIKQPVHAVASGRVVFAKWLGGYGFLIIINHGGGYMTLYGRNQVLLKKVGDDVIAHEIIATVGNSGGFEKPGLYFSIRQNGNPLNPSVWIK